MTVDQVSLAGRTVELSPKLKEYKKRVDRQFLDNLFDPPKFEDIASILGKNEVKWKKQAEKEREEEKAEKTE